MIRYYTNRHLSEAFGVNLARWKRWSREFLPPDPLGGLQSGYARQYSPDEAFRLFIAGYLVSEAGLTIPHARRFLEETEGMLTDCGFRFDPGAVDRTGGGRCGRDAPLDLHVWVHPRGTEALCYRVHRILERTPRPDGGGGAPETVDVRRVEQWVPDRRRWPESLSAGRGARLVPLGALLRDFVAALALPPACFPFLGQSPGGD